MSTVPRILTIGPRPVKTPAAAARRRFAGNRPADGQSTLAVAVMPTHTTGGEETGLPHPSVQQALRQPVQQGRAHHPDRPVG